MRAYHAFGLLLLVAIGVGCGGSARRMQSLNNLHNLGIATHNEASGSAGRLPQGTIRSEEGAALHGWNAQLVRYLDNPALHRQIDFEKPWDDPTNASTMQVVVPYFLYPGRPTHDDAGYALSWYAANQHVVGDHDRVSLDEIMQGDGISSTLLYGEVIGDPKPWGHPANFRDPATGFGPEADQFGSTSGWVGADPVHFLMTDGSARAMDPNIDPAVLKALGTWNGGEELPDEFRSGW